MKIGRRILNEFKKGKKPVELIKPNGSYNKNTVYKYWKLYELWKEITEKNWELIYGSV